MKREAEFFGDRPVELVFIAKKLKEALRFEALLTGCGLDYLVETDRYVGGILFRTERTGAFFYVEASSRAAAVAAALKNGFRPTPIEE